MSKRLWSLTWLVVVCLLVMPLAATRAYAYEDEEEIGSITLYLSNYDDGSDRIEDGEVALYRVASISHAGGDRYDVTGGQFASSATVANISTMDKQELDRQNASLAAALEQEARTQGIEPMQVKPITYGAVSFLDVPEGLYLLFQTKNSSDNRKFSAFLMSIPDEDGEYVVVAKPKPGVPPKEPEKEEEPTTEPDPDPKDPIHDLEFFLPKDDIDVEGDDDPWGGGNDPDGNKDSDDDGNTSGSNSGSDSTTGSSSSSGLNGSGSSVNGYGTSGAGNDGSSITLRVPETGDSAVSPVLVALVGVGVVCVGAVLNCRSKAKA